MVLVVSAKRMEYKCDLSEMKGMPKGCLESYVRKAFRLILNVMESITESG